MARDIALVSLYPPSGQRHAGRSGIASYTANLAHALSGQGAEVTVVAPRERDEPARTRNNGIEVLRPFSRGPSAFVDAARAARATGCPVVHLQFETFIYGGPASLPGLAPALWGLGRTASTVVTMHQVVDPSDVDRDFVRTHGVRSPAQLARAGIGGLQRLIRRLAHAVVVHERSFTRTVAGSNVIPHGVEVLVAPDRARARHELGLDDKPVVLCFGFLAPYKGLENALEATRFADGAFQLVIAGGSHPRLAKRDDYAAKMRARWPDVARFTGYIDEDDVARWFAVTDVALFPYPQPFASSGSLALALAYDTPVLVSPALAACAGTPDELAVPIEPSALAAELTRAFSDPGRMERIRRASRAHASGRTWPEIARQHLGLYEEVLHADRLTRRRVRSG